MTIAVNLFSYISLTNKDFVYALFTRIAEAKQDHQFIFISDKKNEGTILPKNIVTILSAPKSNTRLFRKVWYNYTLPSILRKHKASILINADGLCSLRTNVFQCIFINEVYAGLVANGKKDRIALLQRNATDFLTKAGFVICGSQHQKKVLLDQHKTAIEKIKILYAVPGNIYHPLDFETRELIKDRYTHGKEYFLFNGRIDNNFDNLVNLLKAFSFFKKRQKSNMQLLLLTKNLSAKDRFIASLKTYKYRDEIVLLIDLSESETAAIMGAAYAFVYPVAEENFSPFPFQAIQSEVALLLNDLPAFKEIADGAAIYADATNFQDIADKMMLLFKDENRRAELIKNARLRSQQLKETNPEDVMWQMIEAVATH